MTQRSELRVRKHTDPERKDELIIEVVRGGKVVANIYGSREGLHISAPSFGEKGDGFTPFFVNAVGTPGVIIPLLNPNEECPWCSDTWKFAPSPDAACPVCRGSRKVSTAPGKGKTQFKL